MASLANKYRPQTFEECCGQSSIVRILKRQIEIKQYKNCYLFAGPSGCGKTTIARILANNINEFNGSPIEIDGASNNGVDNVRLIIEEARERSLDSEYKIFIIDECHMLTIQAWNALLKIIEEPPKYTIFMFCTTDPNKLPATIINRCQRFNLTRVGIDLIRERLKAICVAEGFTNYDESCDYIAKLSSGGVRDAISMLEKCAGLSTDLNIENVLSVLGDFSYDTFFELTNNIIDGNQKNAIEIIDKCYYSGADLKLFTNQYFDFVLDLTKYCIFKSLDVIKIPAELEKKLQYTVGIENNVNYFQHLTSRMLDIYNEIKQDTMPRTTLSAEILRLCRGQ